MRKPWISRYKYQEKFGYDLRYKRPDYREGQKICKWCGQELTGRRRSYCSDDCSQFYSNMTVWQRGVSTIPYEILIRDKFTCQLCGEVRIYENEHGMKIPIGVNLEVHHIKPVSEGGTDHEDNLVTLCESCHTRAHKIMSKIGD